MNKLLLYFGCIDGAGHYLWQGERREVGSVDYIVKDKDINPAILRVLDGTFAPAKQIDGKYNEVVIGKLRILSWWDRSVDSRPGSNSSLIGYDYESADEIFKDAAIKFPTVMSRQNKPVPA